MAKKKKKFTKPFAAAMAHYMRLKDITNSEMGERVGYSGVMIDAIKHERSDGVEDKRRLIAKELGFDNYDAFINEGENIIKGQRVATIPRLPNKPPVLSIHHQIIEQFQQKELALEINQGMLELERMNPDELKEVAKYVHYRRSEAKKMLPPEPQKKRS
ncbi:MAG TPA: hypothetical protein VJ946_06940 [Bacteroidales bacterium]|nr:hypothetical protein [Bacteroidales bacterium]